MLNCRSCKNCSRVEILIKDLQEFSREEHIRMTIGNYRWTICGLLFFATTINYLDRQVLSLLSPQLSQQFGWSNTDYANITAVFQFAYAFSMVFAGRIVDKLGTKGGFTLAIIIWSLGAMMHAWAVPIGQMTNNLLALAGLAALPVSIIGFMLSRFVLAVGEAGNFPAAIKATAEYFPKKERSLATGLFNSGANVGAILAPLTVPWIAAHWGWETAFIVIGAVGFIWLFFWWQFYTPPHMQKRLGAEELAYINNNPDEAPAQDLPQQKIPWIHLLGHRQTWAFVGGKFLTDGVWWFYLFWLPKFLNGQYGISGQQLMLPLTVLYSMTMIGSIGGGWFPAYFINKGYTAYDGRLRAMLVIALFPLVVLLAQPLGHWGLWVPIILIGIGASAHQAWSANIFTTVSDMFPRSCVASVVGIGGLAGGLGGVLVSKVGGWIFDYYGAQNDIHTGYAIMFAFCALAYILAWGLMKTLVPRYKPVVFN